MNFGYYFTGFAFGNRLQTQQMSCEPYIGAQCNRTMLLLRVRVTVLTVIVLMFVAVAVVAGENTAWHSTLLLPCFQDNGSRILCFFAVLFHMVMIPFFSH